MGRYIGWHYVGASTFMFEACMQNVLTDVIKFVVLVGDSQKQAIYVTI